MLKQRRVGTRYLIAVLWSGKILLSAAIAHAQTGQLPPWQWADVGAVGTPGHVVQGSDLRAAGAGSNIWGTADSFLYVYQPIRDGGITADVDTETNTSPFAKAAVMIRQTLDPGSPEVTLYVQPACAIQFMTSSSHRRQPIFIAGGSLLHVTPAGGSTVHVPVTLDLSRHGNRVFAAYHDRTSPSSAFVDLGSVEFPAGPALVGVAVTSHDPSALNEAYFRVFPTVFSVPYPWSTLDVGAVGTRGSATYDETTGVLRERRGRTSGAQPIPCRHGEVTGDSLLTPSASRTRTCSQSRGHDGHAGERCGSSRREA